MSHGCLLSGGSAELRGQKEEKASANGTDNNMVTDLGAWLPIVDEN